MAAAISFEIEEPPHLRGNPFYVFLQLLGRKQVSFFTLATGISDHARGTSDQGNGSMARFLKTAQHHQLHHAAHVQTRRGRIETDVDGLTTRVKKVGQPVLIGALVDQSAPSEFIEEIVLRHDWIAWPESLRRPGGLRER